jgi:hypothetical protein
LDVLKQIHVPLVQAGSGNPIQPRIHSLAAFDRRCEAGRIDESINVSIGAGEIWIAVQYNARSDIFASSDLTVQLRGSHSSHRIGNVRRRSGADARQP